MTCRRKPLECASVVTILSEYRWYAKVAELVDALASGVSVLTDVGFKSPSHHNPRRYCSHWAKVAELVDALASGVSVLTDVGFKSPSHQRGNIPKKEYCAKVAELVDALASGVSVLTDVGFKSPSHQYSSLSRHYPLSLISTIISIIPPINATHDGSRIKWRN